ncbi:MAG: small lipoprotein [Leptospira bouyouniensis]
MKNTIICFMLLGTIGCSNLYSPFGVKGKDAKKQIEDLNSSLGLLSFPLLLSSFSSSSSSSFTCPTETTATVGSASNTSGGTFTLPAASSYVDLDGRASGTKFFRSNAASVNTTFSLKILKTATTNSTASCSYVTSAGGCTDADLVGLSFTSSSSTSVSAASCLAIKCTNAAYIRIQNSTGSSLSSSSSSSSASFLSLALSPEILNEVSGIEDDKYYTKESLEKCKEGLTTISLFQSSLTVSSVNAIQEISSCNKPFSSLPASVDSSGIAALQGNECKLEEVNAIGF